MIDSYILVFQKFEKEEKKGKKWKIKKKIYCVCLFLNALRLNGWVAVLISLPERFTQEKSSSSLSATSDPLWPGKPVSHKEAEDWAHYNQYCFSTLYHKCKFLPRWPNYEIWKLSPPCSWSHTQSSSLSPMSLPCGGKGWLLYVDHLFQWKRWLSRTWGQAFFLIAIVLPP